ncbi:HAD family hydrolase [Paracoccus fontiphilus]|uniref:HAD family hydrolase n=1 Tax=Paracoccus fontiphilus TaxID=1815556 RepID=A0ABV7IE22_9RHOB|nr:HAD family hydrolase [Paracoccus fontiphilus]
MLVFDLDDTLYLERDFAFSGYAAIGAHLDRTDGQGAGHRFAETCRMLFLSGERRRIIDRALATLDRPSRPDEAAALIALYRDHVPQIALCPDAAAFLDRWPGRMGLITDGPERTQRNKIDALRLTGCLDPIIPTGQWPLGFGKPHPRAFAMMEAIGQGRCIYVADNPLKDFVTPKARGWMTIRLARPERVHHCPAPDDAHEAEAVITTLNDLDPLLEGWTQH